MLVLPLQPEQLLFQGFASLALYCSRNRKRKLHLVYASIRC